MHVTFVHCLDWYIPGEETRDVLGKHRLAVCSHRDGKDWDTFKDKVTAAGLKIQVLEVNGKTTAALVLKGKIQPDPKPEEDNFFPVPAEDAPFPVLGDKE